jgi:hypothetical protein
MRKAMRRLTPPLVLVLAYSDPASVTGERHRRTRHERGDERGGHWRAARCRPHRELLQQRRRRRAQARTERWQLQVVLHHDEQHRERQRHRDLSLSSRGRRTEASGDGPPQCWRARGCLSVDVLSTPSSLFGKSAAPARRQRPPPRVREVARARLEVRALPRLAVQLRDVRRHADEQARLQIHEVLDEPVERAPLRLVVEVAALERSLAVGDALQEVVVHGRLGLDAAGAHGRAAAAACGARKGGVKMSPRRRSVQPPELRQPVPSGYGASIGRRPNSARSAAPLTCGTRPTHRIVSRLRRAHHPEGYARSRFAPSGRVATLGGVDCSPVARP